MYDALLSGADPGLRREVDALLALPSVPDDATATLPPPLDQFGPYKITSLIGHGGMGQVFRGVDTRLGRTVAIKTLQERFGERFEREARAISALNHPHVCTLYDVGTAADGTNYLVMELVEGETLAARLKEGPLTITEALRYGMQIADALVAANARGMVHRDLKPANIMLASFGVKVLDFGLAKMEQDAALTMSKALMGTPAYMSPEQTEGSEADARSDLFALGLVLYEMVAGHLPVPGKSLGGMLNSGSIPVAPHLAEAGPDISRELDSMVAKLLAKSPAARYQSAAEVVAGLSVMKDRLAGPPVTGKDPWRRPFLQITAGMTILLAAMGGGWFNLRSQHQRWALEAAVPEITRLQGELKPLSAFRTLLLAEQYLPGNPNLAQAAKGLTRLISVKTPSPGTKIEIQDYSDPGGAWYALGMTPLEKIRIPQGYFRWRISTPGSGEFVTAPGTADRMEFPYEPAQGVVSGMVHVPAGPWRNFIGFVGWLGFQLPAFDIDQFEVTNREFQKFVDDGGYQKREYWKEKFVQDGKELTWERAMELFRDPTGRPGPSVWEAGHFPEGQSEYPVSGVSWYEASAYEVYVRKSLPAFGEWYKAAPAETASLTTNQSNFSGKVMPVAASNAVGPFGTYDLTGNVREWCLNAADGNNRFILGGAFGTQTYQAFEPEALPPFDRSAMNGFRGLRNRDPLPAEAAAPVVRRSRDFARMKPATDEVFNIYKSLYAYDKRPLKTQSSGGVEETRDWTRERVTIDAGYGNERLPIYLFQPHNVKLPNQTVVFFPSARVNGIPRSQTLGDMDFIDYVIRSGRAVVYPIYQGTYERDTGLLPGEIDTRELVIQQSKEVRRTVDYLESRPDIADKNKLAYLGVSQGAAHGVIFMALEDRFKAVVFLDGGFFLGNPMAGGDQADFAPHVKAPVLMLNGKYDFSFPPDQSQLPMFQMIGTAPADKVRKVFETPHNISQVKPELAKEVLTFLDKYLGRVD